MSEAGSVRRRRIRIEVEKLVADYEAGGLTRDGFCQQRGLSVAALDKYRRRVQKWVRFGGWRDGSRGTQKRNAVRVNLRDGR